MGRLADMRRNLVEQRKSLFGFRNIETRDGEAGMNNDKVADRDAVEQCQRDSVTNAADLDLRLLVVEQYRDTDRNRQAHRSIPDHRASRTQQRSSAQRRSWHCELIVGFTVLRELAA